MTIEELLSYAISNGISDVFITTGKPASFRLSGQLTITEDEPASAAEIDKFRKNNITVEAEKEYQTQGSVDAAYFLETGERFRINFYQNAFGPAMVVRPIHSGNELYIESLGLPIALTELCMEQKGLILITGESGTGKSTTVGAMVNFINQNLAKHIITLEEPIEFLHGDVASVVSQRELSGLTIDKASAIESVLRESPDVIILPQIDSLEVANAAIKAALSGHLVIAEMSALNVVQAAEQIVMFYPEDLRSKIAVDLSKVLLGVSCQKLLRRIDGAGLVAAVEFLRCSTAIKKLLAGSDFPAIKESLNRASDNGTLSMCKAVFHLVKEGFLDQETGETAVESPAELDLLIRGMDVQTQEKQYGTPEDAAEGDVVDLPKLLRTAVKLGASDLHLSVGAHPMLRVHGELRPLGLPRLKDQDTKRLLFGMLTPRQRLNFEEKRELDLALAVTLDGQVNEFGEPEICRFRVNAYFQRDHVGVVARVITSKIPSPEKLNLPEAIINLTEKSQGLILVTGPTGSGKSTTLASLIDQINRTRPEHIITIEDPIEYVHSNKQCLIQQREVGADTLSFSAALKSALRQDPDVILVGEMRDTETIGAALTAAETGHLVMATLHTNSAAQTIDRIIDTFPPEQQGQIKLQLSGCILGIISQRLLSRADADGRVAAFEILIGTPPIQALVRDGKTSQLQSILETGYKDGMITMRRSLEELLEAGLIFEEEAKSLSLEAVEVQAFE